MELCTNILEALPSLVWCLFTKCMIQKLCDSSHLCSPKHQSRKLRSWEARLCLKAAEKSAKAKAAKGLGCRGDEALGFLPACCAWCRHREGWRAARQDSLLPGLPVGRELLAVVHLHESHQPYMVVQLHSAAVSARVDMSFYLLSRCEVCL